MLADFSLCVAFYTNTCSFLVQMETKELYVSVKAVRSLKKAARHSWARSAS